MFRDGDSGFGGEEADDAEGKKMTFYDDSPK